MLWISWLPFKCGVLNSAEKIQSIYPMHEKVDIGNNVHNSKVRKLFNIGNHNPRTEKNYIL